MTSEARRLMDMGQDEMRRLIGLIRPGLKDVALDRRITRLGELKDEVEALREAVSIDLDPADRMHAIRLLLSRSRDLPLTSTRVRLCYGTLERAIRNSRRLK
ncbi:hypothetical protein KW800_03130 [Candidatus Parcubacteria bacterium]|nr:hypothetical protein [Candidatus Parcubacteria bacterium]